METEGGTAAARVTATVTATGTAAAGEGTGAIATATVAPPAALAAGTGTGNPEGISVRKNGTRNASCGALACMCDRATIPFLVPTRKMHKYYDAHVW